jgi:hypothetical protein
MKSAGRSGIWSLGIGAAFAFVALSSNAQEPPKTNSANSSAAVPSVVGATISPKSAKVEIYVDPYGDDSGAGDAASPLKTLRAAVRRALVNQENGQSVKIRVVPGVYREPLNLAESRTPTKSRAILVIEPTDKGTITLTGADRFRTDWLTTPTKSVYRSFSSCEITAPEERDIALGRALVYVDDQPFWLVAKKEQLTPNRAWIEPGTGSLYLHMPNGFPLAKMVSVSVEVVRRNFVFRIARSHVAVRGVRAERSSLLGGIVSGQNILLEDCAFVQNAGSGLVIENSEAVTLRRTRLSRNAASGLFLKATKNLRLEDLETAENNDSSEADVRAGISLIAVQGAFVSGLRCLHNRSHGVRIEGDSREIRFENALIVNNLRAGVSLFSPGPVTFANSRLSENDRGIEAGQIALNLIGSRLYGNTVTQFRIAEEGIKATFENTTIAAVEPLQSLFTADPQDAAPWNTFLRGFTGKSNVYFRPAIAEKAFGDFSPANSAEWQKITDGRDVAAVWREPEYLRKYALTLSEDGSLLKVEATNVPGTKNKISLVRVGFYDQNRNLWGESLKPPFTLDRRDLPPGEHRITAWGMDKEGNLFRSPSLPLMISAP